jgi:hypothetical protein
MTGDIATIMKEKETEMKGLKETELKKADNSGEWGERKARGLVRGN